jgi:HEAT repeats
MRLAVCVVALAIAGVAEAQPNDVPALIKLIENQPNDMDRTVWKEKRRDAAKKLAQSKDKRAVPTLMKLAEGETFDIIGEIAIEGLGNIGDPSAIPTLQKIANDQARDKGQRELARRSLAKLGTAEPPPAGDKPPPGGDKPPPGGDKPGDKLLEGGDKKPPGGDKPGGKLVETDTGVHSGGKPSGELPAIPDLPDDTLAAYERVSLSGGSSSFSYDTVRKRYDFNADVAVNYARRIERPQLAWGYDFGLNLVAGYVNPDGRAQTRKIEFVGNADAEARFYAGNVYGIGRAVGVAQWDYLSVKDPNDASGGSDFKDSRFNADVQVAVGGGFGRILDVGAAIRVRRLSRTLDAARALGKPIDAATAKKLQLTWWALRGERSTYPALVATVAILREAGILLGEPDAGLAYAIINVLRDTQLYQRPEGLDINVVFGEGYLKRPDNPMILPPSGRYEQVIASAGYGQQLDEDKLELSGTGYARLRVFAPDMQPAPWAFGAIASMRRFTYGDHGDPFGMFDLTGEVGLSTDDLMMSTAQLRIAGSLGFTWWLNQASGFRLAASVMEDAGELFIGAQLQATYGLLDGTFAHM